MSLKEETGLAALRLIIYLKLNVHPLSTKIVYFLYSRFNSLTYMLFAVLFICIVHIYLAFQSFLSALEKN